MKNADEPPLDDRDLPTKGVMTSRLAHCQFYNGRTDTCRWNIQENKRTVAERVRWDDADVVRGVRLDFQFYRALHYFLELKGDIADVNNSSSNV